MQTTRTLEVALRATSSQFVSETNRAEEALAKLHKELADTQAAAKAASALAALKREMRMSEEGQKAEATLRALSGSSREATDIFGRLGGGIRGVASELAGAALAFVSVGAALGGLNKLLGDSFTRLQDGEREAVMLAASFNFTGKQTEYLSAQVAKLSASSKFLPGDLTQAQAAILKFGATRGELEALLPAAVNLARAFNVDVVTAANAVARGIAGDGESLRQFGVVVTGSMDKAEKISKVLIAGGKAAEANKLYNDTLAGSLDSLRLSWDNLTSRLGDALKDEGKAVLDWLDAATQKTTGWIDKLDRAGAFDWSRIKSVLMGDFPTLAEARASGPAYRQPRLPRAIRRGLPEFGAGLETNRDQRQERPPRAPRAPRGAAAGESLEEIARRAYDISLRTAALSYKELKDREDATLAILKQEAADTRLTLDTRLQAEERIRQIVEGRLDRERREAREMADAQARADRELEQEATALARQRLREEEQIQDEIRQANEESARRVTDLQVAGAKEVTRLLSKLAGGQGVGAGDIAGSIASLAATGATLFGGPLAGGLASVVLEPIAAFFSAQDARERANAERLKDAADKLADAGKDLRERLAERAKAAYLNSLNPTERKQAEGMIERELFKGEIRGYGAKLGLSEKQISEALGENTGYNRKTQNVGDLFNFLGAVLYQGVTGKQVDLSFMYPPDVKQKLDEAYGPTPEQQAPAAPTVASAGAEAAMMAIRNLADLLEQGNLEPFAERGTNADSPLYVYDTSRDDAGFGFAPRAFFFRGRIGTPRTTAGPQTLGASV